MQVKNILDRLSGCRGGAIGRVYPETGLLRPLRKDSFQFSIFLINCESKDTRKS